MSVEESQDDGYDEDFEGSDGVNSQEEDEIVENKSAYASDGNQEETTTSSGAAATSPSGANISDNSGGKPPVGSGVPRKSAGEAVSSSSDDDDDDEFESNSDSGDSNSSGDPEERKPSAPNQAKPVISKQAVSTSSKRKEEKPKKAAYVRPTMKPTTSFTARAAASLTAHIQDQKPMIPPSSDSDEDEDAPYSSDDSETQEDVQEANAAATLAQREAREELEAMEGVERTSILTSEEKNYQDFTADQKRSHSAIESKQQEATKKKLEDEAATVKDREERKSLETEETKKREEINNLQEEDARTARMEAKDAKESAKVKAIAREVSNQSNDLEERESVAREEHGASREQKAWESLVLEEEHQRSSISQRDAERAKRQNSGVGDQESSSSSHKKIDQKEVSAKKKTQDSSKKDSESPVKPGRQPVVGGWWKEGEQEAEQQPEGSPQKKRGASSSSPGRQDRRLKNNSNNSTEGKEHPVTPGSSTTDGPNKKKREEEDGNGEEESAVSKPPTRVKCLELNAKSLVKSGSNTLLPREKHCLVSLEGGSSVLAVGGVVGGKPESGLMVFRTAGSVHQWRQLRTMGCAVPPISGHTCTFLQDRNTIVVIGGTKMPSPSAGSSSQKQDRFGPTAAPNASASQEAGVYTLELGTMKWSLQPASQQVNCSVSTAGAPPHNPNMTKYHSSCFYLGSVYVYGGVKAGGGKGSSLDVLDTASMKWTQLSDVEFGPERPPALSGHSAVVFNHQMYIFGGKTGLDAVSNELWVFNFELFAWRRVNVDTDNAAGEGEEGTAPPARSNHASLLHGHYWIIHGGTAGDGVYLGDMWALDLHTNVWYRIKLPNSAPTRQCHAMAMLPPSAIPQSLGQRDDDGKNSKSTGATKHSPVSSGGHEDATGEENEADKNDEKDAHKNGPAAPVLMLYGGGGVTQKSEYSQLAYSATNEVHFIPFQEAAKKKKKNNSTDDHQEEEGSEEDEDEEVVGENDCGGQKKKRHPNQNTAQNRPATAPSRGQAQRHQTGDNDSSDDGDAGDGTSATRESEAAIAKKDRELIKRGRRFKEWNLTHTFTPLGPRTTVGRGEVPPLSAKGEQKLAVRLSKSRREDQVAALRRKLDAQRQKDQDAWKMIHQDTRQSNQQEDDDDDEKSKKQPGDFREIARRMHDAEIELRGKRRVALLKKHLPAPDQPVRSTEDAENIQVEMYTRQVKMKKDAWARANRKHLTPARPENSTKVNVDASNDRLYASRKNQHMKTIDRLRRKYCPPPEKHVIDDAQLAVMFERLVPEKATRPMSPNK